VHRKPDSCLALRNHPLAHSFPSDLEHFALLGGYMINHFSTSLCFSESVEALAFLVPAVGRPRTLAIFTFGAIYIAATLQLFEYEEFLAKVREFHKA